MRLLSLLFALSIVSPGLVLAETPHDESVPHVHAPAKSSKDETPVDYFWRKSDEAFHAGDYPRAIGLHRAITALDPTEIESFSVGSWLLWSLGKPAEAIEFIQSGLKANPKDAEMWDVAGQHFDLQKRFADSTAAFEKAVELSGKSADMMLRRRFAHASEHSGDLAQSLRIWRALVADFPADAVNKNNMTRVEKAHSDAQNGKNAAVAAITGAAVLGILTISFSKSKTVARDL
ncbi:MAG TPA: hypothetical protein VGB45_03520 [Abditibacterium sp.]|jgi:tetratricopeptide (TPR) repeat protein